MITGTSLLSFCTHLEVEHNLYFNTIQLPFPAELACVWFTGQLMYI